MSEYAEPKWQDCRGSLHDTEIEALLASRRNEIGVRMRSTFESDALAWFLRDAERIISVYEGISRAVDDLMKEAK